MIFSYRLAEHLHMIRDEMVDRMTWLEFQTWAVFLNWSHKQQLPPSIQPRQRTPEEQLKWLDSLNQR